MGMQSLIRHPGPSGRGPARKKRRENVTPPGEVRYEASTAKASRQSPIIVRLGTDSVNSFRQQIYKSLVSVALKPQTAWLARKLYSPQSAALGRMYAERGP